MPTTGRLTARMRSAHWFNSHSLNAGKTKERVSCIVFTEASPNESLPGTEAAQPPARRHYRA